MQLMLYRRILCFAVVTRIPTQLSGRKFKQNTSTDHTIHKSKQMNKKYVRSKYGDASMNAFARSPLTSQLFIVS